MAGRRLLLIRHAKSDYPLGVADHDRPLNARGARDAPAVGRWLADHVAPSVGTRVCLSGAERVQQTWTLAAGELGEEWSAVPVVTDDRVYEASPGTLRQVILDQLRVEGAEPTTVVLVGHSPGLPQLVAELGRPSAIRADALEKFPTSAVAVLETRLPWTQAAEGPATFDVSSFAIPRG